MTTCRNLACKDKNMPKDRIPIPTNVADALMFQSNGTCCRCQQEGRHVQIHHIDEDPSNNEPANLAVLCLLCHDDTQIKGGFGKKLSAGQVTQYRDDWHARVQKRKDEADKIAAVRLAGLPLAEGSAPIKRDRVAESESLLRYIEVLPAIRQDIYRRARPKWESANAAQQRGGNRDVNDVLTQILVALASWYPPNHFNGQEAAHYINSAIASRYVWHRASLQPGGSGTGGRIINLLVGARVTSELEHMITDVVSSLGSELEGFTFGEWKTRWEANELQT